MSVLSRHLKSLLNLIPAVISAVSVAQNGKTVTLFVRTSLTGTRISLRPAVLRR